MTFLQAVKTGLLKSFQFNGRASRAEFWKFAPVAIVPPLVTGYQIGWFKIELYAIWRIGVIILSALPLLAAGARRLQDSGEEGHQIMVSFLPLILLWIAFQGLYWFSLYTMFFGFGLIVGFFSLLILVPAYIAALFVSFMFIGPVVGMLLLPSQPGPNRYGPNPYEVTP